MTLELEKIVKACQRRESKAQKALYDMFAPRMMGVCMRYVRSRDEAQDILQEGFIQIFATIATLRNIDSVESWMRRIMINSALNYLKLHKGLVYCDLQEWEYENRPQLTSMDEKLDTDGLDVLQVLEALGTLSAEHRMAFNMRVVDEMEYVEMASLLGVKEATLRSWVSRACKELKKLLTNNTI